MPSVRPHVPYYVRLFPITEIRDRTKVAESGVSVFEAWQFRDSNSIAATAIRCARRIISYIHSWGYDTGNPTLV